MLQIQAKDRLDKVSSIIKKLKLRFPVAEVSEKLGIDKGMTSAYLGGKKPMSANFYSSFMKEFGEGFEEETISSTQSPIIKTESTSLESLIRSNEMLSKANMDLSANVVMLTKMLSSSVDEERILRHASSRSDLLELLSPLLRDSLGLESPTNEAAALELDKRLTEIEKKTLIKGKKNV